VKNEAKKKVYPEQRRRVFVAMSPRFHSERADGAKRTVFVAMSGGVDSSVAALLLKKQNYNVIGVFMRCYNIDGCAVQDAEDARRVAEKLDIPFYVWDFENEYKKRVVNYMIEGYRQGITPNPDIMCNKEIKFGLFLEKALEAGANYVATGHYVRLAKGKLQMANSKKQFAIRYKLFAARDAQKDQSYFLWTLTRAQLKHCLFPIGDYLKSEVREIAKKGRLPTAEKKDSQGICFLGKITLSDFLKKYIPQREGAVVSTNGKNIGTHSGSEFYTIGQRQGLGISNPIPLYISDKNTNTNTITVAEGENNSALYKSEINLTELNFIGSEKPSTAIDVLARVRYRQPLAKAKLSFENGNASLIFNEPQKFVASGQSAVFYSAERENTPAGRQILGGGVISHEI